MSSPSHNACSNNYNPQLRQSPKEPERTEAVKTQNPKPTTPSPRGHA